MRHTFQAIYTFVDDFSRVVGEFSTVPLKTHDSSLRKGAGFYRMVQITDYTDVRKMIRPSLNTVL